MRGAVITGVGCVTPIGTGLAELTQSLKAGTSGTGPLTQIDPRPYQCRVAAELRDFRAHDFMPLREARSSPRVVQFAVAASRMAVDHAGLGSCRDRSRIGVIVGSSGGPSAYHYEQFAIFLERGVRRMHPSFPGQAHHGVIASECAIQLDLHGPVFCLSSACTSGADALGLGSAMIQAGLAEALLVGGAEAPIFPILFATLDRLGVMPTRFNDAPETAARPFAADREGFVLGEGAAMFVLESVEHAARRGARPLAEVAGYGATCDARSHFSQDESGDDAERAIRDAMQMAGVSPEEIDYVNAHGSATRQNDPFETRILRRVLGERADGVPVSSSKSMFGHLLGASGAVEAAATIAGMQNEFLPPTLNLLEPDPECDLDYVACGARAATIDVALSTSFGFGSRNAAVVLRRAGNGD